MNTGGEAAEQIVRMSLEGFEVAAKITGAGAKNIAILLYSILKEEQKTKGKARLTNMLRSGKELKGLYRQKRRLKRSSRRKQRNTAYSTAFWRTRGNKDPNAEVDVIARAEDASKISRIVERFQSCFRRYRFYRERSGEIERSKGQNAKGEKRQDEKCQDSRRKKMQGRERTARAETPACRKKAEKDRLMDALMGKQIKKRGKCLCRSSLQNVKKP